MDWYPWYPGLYKTDTMHLTLAEDGAYRRLIDEYMATGRPLPSTGPAIARIIGISLDDWNQIAPVVLPFFQQHGLVLHHKRCDIELERQSRLSKKRSEVARKAAEERNKNQSVAGNSHALAEQNSATRQDKTRQEKEPISLDIGMANGELFNLPKPSRKKPATGWPPHFEITPEMAAYSRRKMPATRPQSLFEEFQNYHVSKGSTFSSWPAAFRTWVDNAAKRAQGIRR